MKILATMVEYRRFFAVGQCLNKIVTLWNFNMWINHYGKIVTWLCNIMKSRLIVEPNGWKFEPRGSRNCICGVLFMSDSLSSVWGHLVHFAKFPMLRFSKGYYSPSFIPISNKLNGKYGNRGEYRLLLFDDFPNFKNIMALWIFC